MKFKVGDLIKPNDERYVYKVDKISEVSFGDTYMCTSISVGHGRWFPVKDNHYKKATEQDIENDFKHEPKHFPYWVANKKDVIVRNGYILAENHDRAKEIFNGILINTNGVGDYHLSDEPKQYA